MIFNKALEIITIIEKRGYTALIVGGAVRDFLMQRPVPDIDLATDMPMDQLSRLFLSSDIGRSKDFGILGIEYKGEHFEISEMTRKGVHSKRNASGEQKEMLFSADARRRDFTINAMAMDRAGMILDPLEGQVDIENKIIRTVREPDRVFNDDPLRLFRAIRFASALGFEIEPGTLEGIERLSSSISTVAPERIGRELILLASLPGKDLATGLRVMERTGLLEQILPEISILNEFDHDPEHHPEGGVYRHTLAALRANKKADPGINLSILFHDCGKAVTYDLKEARPSYCSHDKAGEAIIRKAGARLRFSRKLIGIMSFVALNHMKGLRIGEMRPSKTFRLMTHPCWPVLEAAVRCDLLARSADRARRFDREAAETARKLRHWMDKEKSKPRPVITGRQVMEYTGLAQGPDVGRIMKLTTTWAIDNQVTDQARIREYALNASRLKKTEMTVNPMVI